MYTCTSQPLSDGAQYSSILHLFSFLSQHTSINQYQVFVCILQRTIPTLLYLFAFVAAYSRQKDIYSGLNKVSVQLLLFLHAHAVFDVGAGSGLGHMTYTLALQTIKLYNHGEGP